MVIKLINSQLTHILRPTSKCMYVPSNQNITEGFFQDTKMKHEADQVFQLQKKQVWRKGFITVTSSPLVSEKLEVVGYEFCWLNPTTSNQCRQNPGMLKCTMYVHMYAGLHVDIVPGYMYVCTYAHTYIRTYVHTDTLQMSTSTHFPSLSIPFRSVPFLASSCTMSPFPCKAAKCTG